MLNIKKLATGVAFGALTFGVLSVGFSAPAYAQVTTSSVRGVVTTADGSPVMGAVVTIEDTRNGLKRQTSTAPNGQFGVRNLQVGGPYSVTVTSDALQSKTIEDVSLDLGGTADLSFVLTDDAARTLETIVVSASAAPIVQTAIGPNATFSIETLETAPAINRNITDVMRLDPRIYVDEAFVDSIQCAGGNPRYNSLTVDGVRMNDSFGLNSNGYPTERIPFSYDAIEQVAVELAPFDVQYGNFSACNINAVTKSGGNEFHGGFFFDYTDDSLTGDSLEGQSVNVAPFEETRYGIQLGGPIIKDKLFFYAAYEKQDGVNTFDRGPLGSGAVDEVRGLTQEDYDRIVDIAKNVYQYDPGATPVSADNEDEKLLVKLDWNITDRHRANLTFNYNDGFNISQSDGDADEFEFDKHLYERGAELTSYVSSVYSDWTDNFSTEVRLSYLELDNRQISQGGTEFGEIIVSTSAPSGDRAKVYLGADDSRHANKLKYDVTSYALKANYQLENHNFGIGFEREELNVFNLFNQHLQGQIEFNSIDFFEQGVFDDYDYTNAPSGNVNDAAASWGYAVNTAYLQDTWTPTSELSVTYGLRYDGYESDDTPAENADFVASYGYSNALNLDGEGLLQPRFGFTLDATDSLALRGGFGLYSGGNPNVWLSNTYSGTNVNQFTVNEGNLRNNGLYIDDVTTVFDLTYTDAEAGTPGGPGWAVPVELKDLVLAGDGSNFEMNVLDPDFEIPSEWKLALGGTYILDAGRILGSDYILNADLLWARAQDSAVIRYKGITDTGADRAGGLPVYASTGVSAYELTNADTQTTSFNASVSVAKSHDIGIDWSLGYAFSDVEEVQPMNSAVAFSNFNSRTFIDLNADEVATSSYNIAHRFTMLLNYEHEFFGDYATKVSLFGQANSGRPFSFTFDSDNTNSFNGFTPFLEAPIQFYVPEGGKLVVNADGVTTNDPNIQVTPEFAAEVDAFNAYLAANDLTDDAGGFAQRNGYEGDWWTKFDLKLEQEFPGALNGHKTAAFLIVDNLTNLLNDEWGVQRETSFPRTVEIVDASMSTDANGNPVFVYEDFIPADSQSRVGASSLWSIRVGLKYEF